MRNANKKQPASKTSPKDWAARIAASWQQAVQSIIETGRLLVQAKDDLDHGNFHKMIEEQLPFSARTAQMLMKISENPVLSKAKHVSCLPPSWGTLYQLTHLPEEALEAMLADGTIHPEIQRKQAEDLAKKIKDGGWAALREGLNALIETSKIWPNPAKPDHLAWHLRDEGFEPDDLGDLVKWIIARAVERAPAGSNSSCRKWTINRKLKARTLPASANFSDRARAASAHKEEGVT
jgi:hypothetical protein